MVKQKLTSQFAKNIKHYRQLAGLTQEDLANLAGLHRTYIGGIESNSRNVSLSSIEKIAKALHVSPDELLKDRGKDGK